MQLFHFMCTFAWADMEIQQEEREMIERLMISLNLSPSQFQTVLTWLDDVRSLPDIDPYEIHPDFREQIYQAAEAIVLSDGEVTFNEKDMLDLLRQVFIELKSGEISNRIN